MSNDRSDPDQQPLAISKDDVFHIIQNPRRRAVLRYLLEHDDHDQFTLSDLAEEIAAWEHDTTVQDLTSAERQRVYIALYQSHLPKLDEYNIIKYDQGCGIIEPTPLIRVFDPYLDDGLHDATDSLPVEGDDTAEGHSSHGLDDILRGLFRE